MHCFTYIQQCILLYVCIYENRSKCGSVVIHFINVFIGIILSFYWYKSLNWSQILRLSHKYSFLKTRSSSIKLKYRTIKTFFMVLQPWLIHTHYILYTKILGQIFRTATSDVPAIAASTSLLNSTWLLWESAACCILPIILNHFSCVFILCIFAHDTCFCFLLLLRRENGDFQGHLVFKGKRGSASRDQRCTLPPHCYRKRSLETCNSTCTSQPRPHVPHRATLASRGALGHLVLRELVNQDHW